jgi:hypothetical protein
MAQVSVRGASIATGMCLDNSASYHLCEPRAKRGATRRGGRGSGASEDAFKILRAIGFSPSYIRQMQHVAEISRLGGEEAFEALLQEMSRRRELSEKAAVRAGSGTTLIAADKTGRQARASKIQSIELIRGFRLQKKLRVQQYQWVAG